MSINKHSPSIQDSYDVVVIGAGVSGLTSSALLSKAGLKVLVLERDKRVGGYLAGFRRKHFRFDSAIHWLNQCGENGMGSKIFNFLGNDWPKPVDQERIRRLKSESIDYLLTNNPDELKDQLKRDFPEDAKGIDKFFRDSRELARFFEVYTRIFRTVESMSVIDKVRLRWLQFIYGWPFLKHIRFHGEEGVERGLKRYFSNPRLRSVFRMENDILGCLIPIAWAYNKDFQNPPIGGSLVIPEWLTYVTRFHGGMVVTDASVDRIDLDGKKVKSVQFKLKNEVKEVQTNYVVAACDVETLYEKMLPKDAISLDLKSRLKDAELYNSSVTISLTLDCTAESLGFEEEMVFLMKDGVKREEHNNGNPETNMISVIAPSLRDPSLSPDGLGTLTIYCASKISYGDYWKTERDEHGNYVRGEAYKAFKEDYANALVERVAASVCPELPEHITFMDIATPVTHWRYTGNRDGSIMGALPGKKNIKMKLAHHQTEIDGLILSGHWSDYGGGVPIAIKTAANATLLVLKKSKPMAFKSLSQFMDGKSMQPINGQDGFESYNNSWVAEQTPADKARSKAMKA